MAIPSISAYVMPGVADIPPGRVSWPLVPSRAVLLIHDMQRYFVQAFPAGAEPVTALLAHISELRDAADACGIPVYYTAQPVKQDPRERGLQADFWGPGMQLDPEHRAIVDTLEPRPHDTVLTKWRYSAFERSDFGDRLTGAGRDQIIITGVFAHIGCLATTFAAFVRDIRPFYVADAVADFSRQKHEMALAIAAGCCARVVTTADALAALSPASSPPAAT